MENWRIEFEKEWPKMVDWLRKTAQFNDPYEEKRSKEVMLAFIESLISQTREEVLEDLRNWAESKGGDPQKVGYGYNTALFHFKQRLDFLRKMK